AGMTGYDNPGRDCSTQLVMSSRNVITLVALLYMTVGLASSTDKLIALTFDDGPRPYVLFGTKGNHASPSLVDVLERNDVTATFFVVGWRLTPRTWGNSVTKRMSA